MWIFVAISQAPKLHTFSTCRFFRVVTPTSYSILSDHLNNQRIDEAKQLFETIPSPNIYLCTKMIAALAHNLRLNDALSLFDKIPVKDTVMWNLMIKGCVDCGNMDMGLKLFQEMNSRNVVSYTTMINGFFKFGKVEEAETLFLKIPERDIAAWNAMIHGYFENGRVEEAVKLFDQMPYRNVISWTSMISGLDQHGRSDDALLIFSKMIDFGVQCNSSTFASVITACANARDLGLGSEIHSSVVKLGYMYDTYVTASLITFYANCKQLDDSCKVFNERLHTDVVIWTSLLTGYGMNCRHEEALNVFGDMIRIGLFPNQSSFTSALNSSCDMESIDLGRGIHGVAVKFGLNSDAFVGNSLVVLYSRCGNINDGLVAFKEIYEKNVVSWNSIIVGCAQHGRGNWALTLFSQMVRLRVDMDDITFTGLLASCSHSGLLEKGKRLFQYLSQCSSIEVTLEHYSCMVDILCRIGKLKEAEDLVKSMPVKPKFSIWLSLLSGCRKHLNLELAERAAENVFLLDPNCTAAYVLLSNIYAFSGRWSDVARIRSNMKRKGNMKQPGCSWVNQKGIRHTFFSGDTSHPLRDKIYEKLEWLMEKLKEYGYIPDQRYALHDVEDEQKEVMLSYHSERLAICFALITTHGNAITIMKNLRVCGDCHSAIKLIAKIVQRDIIVRDSSRFHHFRDGFCSCSDYW